MDTTLQTNSETETKPSPNQPLPLHLNRRVRRALGLQKSLAVRVMTLEQEVTDLKHDLILLLTLLRQKGIVEPPTTESGLWVPHG